MSCMARMVRSPRSERSPSSFTTASCSPAGPATSTSGAANNNFGGGALVLTWGRRHLACFSCAAAGEAGRMPAPPGSNSELLLDPGQNPLRGQILQTGCGRKRANLLETWLAPEIEADCRAMLPVRSVPFGGSAAVNTYY